MSAFKSMFSCALIYEEYRQENGRDETATWKNGVFAVF